MKEIPLTQGKFAMVDDADYEAIMQFKWYAWKSKGGIFYAVRNKPKIKGRGGRVYLHRFLFGDIKPCLVVDHINGDGLDDRRENMRLVSQKNNTRNCRKRICGHSNFKGASFSKAAGRWESYIAPNGKKIHLGLFDSPKEAAEAYDKAAREIFGGFAALNFPE